MSMIVDQNSNSDSDAMNEIMRKLSDSFKFNKKFIDPRSKQDASAVKSQRKEQNSTSNNFGFEASEGMNLIGKSLSNGYTEFQQMKKIERFSGQKDYITSTNFLNDPQRFEESFEERPNSQQQTKISQENEPQINEKQVFKEAFQFRQRFYGSNIEPPESKHVMRYIRSYKNPQSYEEKQQEIEDDKIKQQNLKEQDRLQFILTQTDKMEINNPSAELGLISTERVFTSSFIMNCDFENLQKEKNKQILIDKYVNKQIIQSEEEDQSYTTNRQPYPMLSSFRNETQPKTDNKIDLGSTHISPLLRTAQESKSEAFPYLKVFQPYDEAAEFPINVRLHAIQAILPEYNLSGTPSLNQNYKLNGRTITADQVTVFNSQFKIDQPEQVDIINEEYYMLDNDLKGEHLVTNGEFMKNKFANLRETKENRTKFKQFFDGREYNEKDRYAQEAYALLEKRGLLSNDQLVLRKGEQNDSRLHDTRFGYLLNPEQKVIGLNEVKYNQYSQSVEKLRHHKANLYIEKMMPLQQGALLYSKLQNKDMDQGYQHQQKDIGFDKVETMQQGYAVLERLHGVTSKKLHRKAKKDGAWFASLFVNEVGSVGQKNNYQNQAKLPIFKQNNVPLYKSALNI